MLDTVSSRELRDRLAERVAARELLEFGAFAHGPQAEQAARLLAEEIRAWDRVGRPAPLLSVHPAGTPDIDLPDGLRLEKTHSRLVISWPTIR
jgi:protein-L-isoaspartate(D-aspartate) O-methyltransferase